MSAVRNYFDTNPYAQNVGQAVQGVAGAVGMFTNIAQTVKEAKSIEYDIPSVMPNNPYEVPEYNLGKAFGQDRNIDPKDSGKGLVGQSIMSGMGAGAAMGSMASPMGSAIGAAAGAVGGAISGLFGKRAARKGAEEAKRRERAKLVDMQADYNTNLTSYDSNMDARDRYNKRLENRQRRITRTIG